MSHSGWECKKELPHELMRIILEGSLEKDGKGAWMRPDCCAKLKLVEYKSTISSLTRSWLRWLAVPFCNGLDGTQIPQTTLLLRTCLSLFVVACYLWTSNDPALDHLAL